MIALRPVEVFLLGLVVVAAIITFAFNRSDHKS